jgi:hypothetical protein
MCSVRWGPIRFLWNTFISPAWLSTVSPMTHSKLPPASSTWGLLGHSQGSSSRSHRSAGDKHLSVAPSPVVDVNRLRSQRFPHFHTWRSSLEEDSVLDSTKCLYKVHFMCVSALWSTKTATKSPCWFRNQALLYIIHLWVVFRCSMYMIIWYTKRCI